MPTKKNIGKEKEYKEHQFYNVTKYKLFCPLLKKNCIYEKCVGFTLMRPIKDNKEKVFGIQHGCRVFNNPDLKMYLFKFVKTKW